MAPAIFLDRDGTIIIDKVYLNDPDQVEFLPNAFEGLRMFMALGFKLIVVTNQSGVARGLVTIENLEKIHTKMAFELAKEGVVIEAFYYSPHAAASNHPSRKPNPGMIEDGINDHKINRDKSWMIGDRMGDVGAGYNAQLKTILLKSSKEPITTPMPTLTCDDLLDAAMLVAKMKP